MNKKILYIGVAVLVVIAAAGIFFDNHREYPQSAVQQVATSTVVSVNTASTASTTTVPEQNISENPQAQVLKQAPTASSVTVSTIANNIKISLVAGSTTYSVSVPQGSTAYDAMTILASTTPAFTFKATYYSGLGYFVRAMNGISNGNNMYWTLYINGTYSMVGASSYVLKSGDSVEWRFEK